MFRGQGASKPALHHLHVSRQRQVSIDGTRAAIHGVKGVTRGCSKD